MNNEAKIFKALSDETRLRILALLLTGELCVCELMAALELPQSTASRHLAYLRNTGWVLDRRQGVWMFYRLNDEGGRLVTMLRELLQHYFVEHDEAQAALQRLSDFRNDQAS